MDNMMQPASVKGSLFSTAEPIRHTFTLVKCSDYAAASPNTLVSLPLVALVRRDKLHSLHPQYVAGTESKWW